MKSFQTDYCVFFFLFAVQPATEFKLRPTIRGSCGAEEMDVRLRLELLVQYFPGNKAMESFSSEFLTFELLLAAKHLDNVPG